MITSNIWIFFTILTNFYSINTSDFDDKPLPMSMKYFDQISSNFVFAQKSKTLHIVFWKMTSHFFHSVPSRCATLNMKSNLRESGSITSRKFHDLFVMYLIYKMLESVLNEVTFKPWDNHDFGYNRKIDAKLIFLTKYAT